MTQYTLYNTLYNEFIKIRNEDMWISLYIYLSDFYGSSLETIPHGRNKFEDIKIMLKYATKISSGKEVRKFMNTEAIECLSIKSKL